MKSPTAKFNSNDFTFRKTTMSDAFERATIKDAKGQKHGLLSVMVEAGIVKGPALVREAIVESDRGVIHTESARNALGQILPSVEGRIMLKKAA